MSRAESVRVGRGALLAVVLASFLCFGLPSDRPGFEQTDELFYLVGGLTAHETGGFLIPSYEGHARFEKPPLNYWLIALSYRAFGVGPWEGRLPSVLAGVSSVALTYWLGLLLFRSRRSGLCGACALLSCHLVLDQAHLATTDAVVTLFVLAAFCGFAASIQHRSRWGLVLAWVSMGAAMMQKGPVWALVPLAAVTAWQVLVGRKTGCRWRQIVSPIPVLLCCALVLPWPILVLTRLAENQAVPTMAAELGEHLIPSPLQWPGGVFSAAWRLFLGILPWSVLWWHYRRRETHDPAVALLAVWGFGVALLFGLILVHHRSRYFVPLTPAVALLAGHALAELQRAPEPKPRLWKIFAGSVDLCFPVGAAVSLALLAASAVFVKTAASAAVGAAGLVVAAGAFVAVRRLRRRSPGAPAWVLTAAVAVASLQVLLQSIWPASYLASPAYGLMNEHVRGLPASTSIASVGLDAGERGWAWLGAGRSFPELDPAANRPAPVPVPDASTQQFLLLPTERLADLPAETRARYREVAAQTGPTEELRPLWFLDREEARVEWNRPRRTLVLLRRTS